MSISLRIDARRVRRDVHRAFPDDCRIGLGRAGLAPLGSAGPEAPHNTVAIVAAKYARGRALAPSCPPFQAPARRYSLVRVASDRVSSPGSELLPRRRSSSRAPEVRVMPQNSKRLCIVGEQLERLRIGGQRLEAAAF